MTTPRQAHRLAGAAVFLFLALGCGAAEDPDLVPLGLGGDFTLTGTDGGAFALSSLRGRIVLLFFGYTACPDVCPTTLARLTRVYALLRQKGIAQRVATVFISVDPGRDTPQKLHDYLGYFALPTLGATGTEQQVAAVARQYGTAFEKVPVKSAAGYLMDHSTYVYLIDPLGRVRHLFRHEDSPEAIAKLVTRLALSDCCQSDSANPIPAVKP